MTEDNLNSIKKLTNQSDIRILSETDKFNFECKGCGQCCTNRVNGQQIILQPADIFRLAKNLNMSTEEVVNQYGDVIIGHTSKVPLVLLKNTQSVFDMTPRCVFMNGNKCGVHGFKPTVCHIFPLGRVMVDDGKVDYILQNATCDGSVATQNNEQTLDSWAPDRKDSEQAFVLFANFMHKLHDSIHLKMIDNKHVTSQTKEMLYSALLHALYVHYDTERNFEEQFEENCKSLMRVLNGLTDVYSQLFGKNDIEK